MIKLVLLRHGQSEWNKKNLFTGWTDVGLTGQGESEAREAARLLKQEGFAFDVCYTSLLSRAIKTLWLVLEEMDLMWLPISNSWRLNERHYGALQGLDKAETAARYGQDRVFAWRRGFDVRPPALEPGDSRHPAHDPRYAGLSPQDLPACESLKDTVARVLPLWREVIAPVIRAGKRVLIAAHGNSLRALVKHLDNISDDDIPGVNIPTGAPLVYEMNEHLVPHTRYYLGDPEQVARRARQAADQAKG